MLSDLALDVVRAYDSSKWKAKVKDFSYADAQKDFGFSPLSFEEGIELELKQTGESEGV